MLSTSHPGVLLAKLKSRGLSGLAVRHRRLTSNETDQPQLEDDLHISSLPSPSPTHTETVGDFSPLTPVLVSPERVAFAATVGESLKLHVDSESPITASAPNSSVPSAAVAEWNASAITTSNWVLPIDAPSPAPSSTPVPAAVTSDSLDTFNATINSAGSDLRTLNDENASESVLLKSALQSAEQRSSELQHQLQDRECEVLQLKQIHQGFTERFAELESTVTAVVKASQQRQEQDFEPPAVLDQLRQLTNGLSNLLGSISSTESRVRVELLKQENTSIITEQELAQALAEIEVLRRRNTELERALDEHGSGSDSVSGYAVRSSKFSSREKEFESALQSLKNEVADRDKCILCMMEQMNQAAASHEAAVLLSTTLLHQQKTLNADIERDRQRLLQSLEFYEGVIKQTDASSALIRQQLSEATAENLELQRLIMNQDVRKHETDTKLRIMETNCAMADIDRAVAQSIVDKRLAVEESHFSQRMMRQQQLLEISEARVRELEDENKKLVLRLATADAQKLKHDETVALQQLNLQRTCDELSELKDRLSETRDASAIEVATAAARHAREMQEQQQAAVESARAFKALIQQRDEKIAELSRLVNVLTPAKPQDLLMPRLSQDAAYSSQPHISAARLSHAYNRGTAPV